jgi:predicted metalloprotease with PDZ domain
LRLHSLFLLFFAGVSVAAPAVLYEISFPNAVHHEAEIQASFSGVGSSPLEIFMSRSSPGRYALHEFAKNVSNFRATDGNGHALKVEHNSPSSWFVSPRNGTIVCSYTLFGDRLDGTYAAIDATHAHLNLPATLVWARGFEDMPITLRFDVPPGSGWKAATQLIPNEDGTFSAPVLAGSSLEWMMDSPVELSASPIREWSLDHETFRLALHHQGSDADASVFEDMCKAVVAEEKGVFGQFPKYDGGTYTFIVDYLPYAWNDGMEHRNSTVITSAIDLHNSAHSAIETVAHEFFHSWNVRRMRPKSLEPFDFERANMSGELWFAEGFTNYYGNLILRRTNLASFDEFVSSMSGAVNAVLNDPGRNVGSAVGMSEQAPFVDAAASIDPTNAVNNFISYYTYGQALAFGIDLEIRARYPGKSLDDWMRTMWREHPDVDQPYTMDDLEHTLAEVTGDAPFAREFFADHVQGRQPLDYAQLIAPAGLVLTLAHPGRPWLGISRLAPSETGLELSGPTMRGGPLYQAGLDQGDEIENCGDESVKTTTKLDSCVASHKPGDVLIMKVRGRTGVRTVHVTLAQNPMLMLVPFERLGRSVSPAIQRFRDQWLSSKVDSLPR